jgi:hypothetical protein
MAEQLTFNLRVRGSIPRRPTTLLWLLDEALDHVPRREDGRWYLFGDWGCRLVRRFPAFRWDDERR